MNYQNSLINSILFVFLFIAIVISPTSISGQSNNTLFHADSIWEKIETQLEQSNTPISRKAVVREVRTNCLDSYNCEVETYGLAVNYLEQRFNLTLAIGVCKEIVTISKINNDWQEEANAHSNLFRFYGAQGKTKSSIEQLDLALALFEEHNDIYGIVKTKVYKKLQSLSYKDEKDIIPEIKAILNENEKLDEKSEIYIYRTLTSLCISADLLVEAEEYILKLETYLESDSAFSDNFGLASYVALNRADLYLIKGDTLSAEVNFKAALKIAREEPDKWQEINILHQLSKIERLRGENENAQILLAEARTKAAVLKQYDLLADNFREETFIADEEKRYEDAYIYLNKYHFYTNLFDSRNVDFDIKNHYLEIEKKQIDLAKKEAELALITTNKQLRNAFIYSGLILAVTLLLILGFYRERVISNKLVEKSIIIEEQAEELRLLDKAKSVFFANVSHELKTPLTLLLAPLNNLAEANNLSEKQLKLLKLAKHGGNQLSILINQILSLGKLEVGKLEVKKVKTQLFTYFKTYCAQFNSLAYKKNIKYSADIDIPENTIAEIDREKCRQILYNLLSNAFKFTPTGGTINIRVSVIKSIIEISVQDSGEGISKEDLPKIFERYYQSEDPSKKAIGGTGIGLAICYEYAYRFGGNINVESKLGEGSKFTVQIPVSFSEKEEVLDTINIIHQEEEVYFPLDNLISKKQIRIENGVSKPQILVVEDNVALQDYIRIILEQKYTVTIAENGQAALNCLKTKSNFQLILSDIMMPVMDGFTLVEKLKSNSQTALIPIILLSARAEIESKLKLLHFGIDDYITKPFDERELLVRIKNLLQNQESRKASIAEGGESENSTELTNKESAWLTKFEFYLKQNIENTSLNIPEISSEFALSESSLLRKVKNLIGLTPVQYIQELRLDLARELLETEKYDSIKEIAIKAGYNDTRTFSRNYKKRFGKLPSDYFLAE